MQGERGRLLRGHGLRRRPRLRHRQLLQEAVPLGGRRMLRQWSAWWTLLMLVSNIYDSCTGVKIFTCGKASRSSRGKFFFFSDTSKDGLTNVTYMTHMTCMTHYDSYDSL